MIKLYIQKFSKAGLLLSLIVASSINAEEVVRVNIESGGIQYNVDLTLFDEMVPGTVANFLTYVANGDYTDSFFHRNEVDFIIQGGGFTYDATVGDGLFTYDIFNDIFTGGLDIVPTDPPVLNDFKISNSLGTIAMAKLGTDPNSATSQWFVNMAANSFTLDLQNGGFTVFGKVLANGMNTFNLLTSVPVLNTSSTHPAFVSLPLNNSASITNVSEINDSNLIMVRDISQLYRIDTRVDFDTPANGVSVQKDVIITNYDVAPITISNIDVSNIAAEFSIDVSACSNSTLAISQSCTMSATLTPASASTYSTRFNVSVTDPGHNFVINLTTPAPDISPSLPVVDFGEQQVNSFSQLILSINNIGDRDLTINSLSESGANPEAFGSIDNCTGQSPLEVSVPGSTVALTSFCIVPINFEPQVTGVLNAELRIESDDPDTPTLIIPLTGVSNNDLDGVSAAIEDGVPNSGDGNNDGTLDSNQSNITSFVDSSNTYVTLVSETNFQFDNIALVDLGTLPAPPEGSILGKGAFTFELKNVPPGFTIQIGFVLPVNVTLGDILSYGPSEEDINPNWYSLKDSLLVFENTALQLPGGGTSINRNIMLLTIKDGGDGDSDASANGVILFNGGIDTSPASNNTNQNSGGSGGAMFLLLLVFGLIPGCARYISMSLPSIASIRRCRIFAKP